MIWQVENICLKAISLLSLLFVSLFGKLNRMGIVSMLQCILPLRSVEDQMRRFAGVFFFFFFLNARAFKPECIQSVLCQVL